MYGVKVRRIGQRSALEVQCGAEIVDVNFFEDDLPRGA